MYVVLSIVFASLMYHFKQLCRPFLKRIFKFQNYFENKKNPHGSSVTSLSILLLELFHIKAENRC